MRRLSDILRSNYNQYINIDPEGIGTPDAGTYYQGIFNSKRWSKDSAGTIVYSASGLWTIYDNAEANITVNEDWLGNLVRWTGAGDGTLTLDNSILNYPEGWHFSIYNNTPNRNINILAGGTDVIRTYNNNHYIPAYSYAQIGVIYVNGQVEWYAAIQQETKYGLGQLAKGAVGLNQAVTADAWTLVNNPTYALGTMVNMVDTANGGIEINYPENGVNGVYAKVSIMASMAIPSAAGALDLAFGVDGVISTGADVVFQRAQAGAAQTADMFWPYTFKFSGVVPNGSVINPFIRYSATDTIQIISMTTEVESDAYIGVDVTLT